MIIPKGVKMVPRAVDNLFLYGFDFETQRRLRFDTSWNASWTTGEFTDLDARDLDLLRGNYGKMRQVKYGNNTHLLFKLLFQYRGHYDPNDVEFWRSFSENFHSSPEKLQHQVETLCDARTIQRERQGSPRSATVRAVDEWIDWVHHITSRRTRRPINHAPNKDQVRSAFQTSRGRLINCAGVPIDGKLDPIARRQPDRIPPADRTPIKRDMSPSSAESSQRAKRQETASSREERDRPVVQNDRPRRDSRGVAEQATGQNGTVDGLPPQVTAVETPSKPKGQNQAGSGSGSLNARRIDGAAPELEDAQQVLRIADQAPIKDDGALTKLASHTYTNGLQNRLARYEERLAAHDAIQQEAHSDVREIKSHMGTLMEGMGMLVENISTLSDRMSARMLPKTSPQPKIGASYDEAVPTAGGKEVIQSLTKEVQELKAAALSSATDQSRQLQALLSEIAQTRSQAAAAAKPTPGSSMTPVASAATATYAPSAASLARPEPRTVREALAGALPDMRYHLEAFRQRYDEMDMTKPANRPMAEALADAMLSLEHCITNVKKAQEQ